eukprot:Tbor_TRINITY_DN5198_c8_g2::TRINITY_DN5198_c8_g2_i1::g.25686::m.25686
MSKNNIQVYARARPQSKAEIDSNCKNIVRMKGNVVDLISSAAGHQQRFTLNKAFWSCNTYLPGNQNENCDQEELFKEIGAPLVDEALKGYNTALISYGSTSSGKTYSMTGTETEDGLITRIGQDIFLKIHNNIKVDEWEVAVDCSFMEIYDEKIRCLINPNPNGFVGPRAVCVRDHPKKQSFVQGLTHISVSSGNGIHKLLCEGSTVRSRSADALNIKSSFSHSIFTIHIIQRNCKNGTIRDSRITLVDLGGSEHVNQSGSPQNPNINLSLTTLAEVISQLAEAKKGDISYSKSALTSILKESLGNCKTSILANISPASKEYVETANTLKFIEHAKTITVPVAKNEFNVADIASYFQKEAVELAGKHKTASGKDKEAISRDLELSEEVRKYLLLSLQERKNEAKKLVVERDQNTEALYRAEGRSNESDQRNQALASEKKISVLLANIDSMKDESKIQKAREEIAALEAAEVTKLSAKKEEEHDDFNQNATTPGNNLTIAALQALNIANNEEGGEYEEECEEEGEYEEEEGVEEEGDYEEEGEYEEHDDYEEEADYEEEGGIEEEANNEEDGDMEENAAEKQPEVPEKLVEEVLDEASNEEKIPTVTIHSHELPNNRYLKEPFRVIKIDEKAILKSSRKDRIWEIDMFEKKFRNLDVHGSESFSLEAKKLYRVEKHLSIAARLTLYFFDATHPYILSFSSTERRQRFYELAIALRRSSIMWCPSLVIEGEKNTTIDVKGTTIDTHSGKLVKMSTKSEAKLNIAKMPYEVIDLWYGCFCLENKPLPDSNTVFQSFIPSAVHEMYVIGITDVPCKYMGTSFISDYFVKYLGTKMYFAISSTAASTQNRKKDVHNVFIVICRRSFIARISNIEAMDINSVKKEGLSSNNFSAVGCSLRINESSFAFILVNPSTSATTDPTARAAAIRGLVSNFPFGDVSVDIGVRFDNLIVSGAFGFSDNFTGNDMLIKQINAGNIMSDMQEQPNPPASITGRKSPMRVFYISRPRNCRMDPKSYLSSRAFNGTNVAATFDVFCQRPFLSVFGDNTKRNRLNFQNFIIAGPRIPQINNPELLITSDWIESAPIHCQLKKNCEMYELAEKCPSVNPATFALDFIRLQHINFSIFGKLSASSDKKKILIASGTLPLKNVVSEGVSVEFTCPLYYRGCSVGSLQGEILQVYNESTITDMRAAGVKPDNSNVHLVTCYENQILDKSKWIPSTVQSGKAHEWTGLTNLSTEVKKESFKLPDGKTWKWLTEWRIVTFENDKEGWAYGGSVRNSVEKKKNAHNFRRRRWIRAMEANDAIVLHKYLSQS